MKLYQKALIEIGGEKWNAGNVAEIFKVVKNELQPVIVTEGDLAASVFHAYCHAARLALLFDIPFSIASSCSVGLLPDVRNEFDKDESHDSNDRKFARALQIVREQRQALIMNKPQKRVLPFPDKGETNDDVVYRTCRILPAHSTDDRVSGKLQHPLFDEVVRNCEAGLAVVLAGAHQV